MPQTGRGLLRDHDVRVTCEKFLVVGKLFSDTAAAVYEQNRPTKFCRGHDFLFRPPAAIVADQERIPPRLFPEERRNGHTLLKFNSPVDPFVDILLNNHALVLIWVNNRNKRSEER